MNPGPREGNAPNGPLGGRRNMGTSRKGSVKAARERLEVAQNNHRQGMLAAGRSQDTYSNPNQLVSRFQAQPRDNQTPPTSSTGRPGAQRHPQWAIEVENQEWYMGDGQSLQAQRNGPPQRPPRPSFVPSILDPTQNYLGPQEQPPRISTQRPTEPYQPHAQYSEYDQSDSPRGWSDENHLTPNRYSNRDSGRPITLSSQSTASSLGDIPDFPIVPNPHQQKKVPLIGPPRAARRGPSSYYSQMSFVSPIVEESEGTKSRNSFASSNVFPPEQHDFYYDDGERSIADEGELEKDSQFFQAPRQEGHRGPVRKASFGRREKPLLTTIRSGDTLRDDAARQAKASKTRGAVAQAAIAAGAAGGAFAAGFGSRNGSKGNSRVTSPGGSRSELSSGTGLLDDSSSDSDSLISPIHGAAAGRPNITRSRSPLATSVLESDSDAPRGTAPAPNQPVRQSSLADRASTRRPPRLNMDAVRDAEARGSLTSLPDLIRRATRLAANLDRGKTASRLGMDFFPDGIHNKDRASGSLSDMLASFPPPALGTPDQASFNRERGSKWPSARAFDQISTLRDEKSQNGKKKGRRCCGMPLWVFIVVMLVLFLLIAAAVVVPVVLIVLPRQRDSQTQTSSASLQCGTTFSCQNNGVAIVTPGGSCSCLCRDGFTGEQCTTTSDASCTTMSVPGADTATLGNVIPRLLEDANKNFSIPLDSAQVVAQLNAAGLSCRAENSLVNFGSVSSRRSASLNSPEPYVRRQDSSPSATSSGSTTPTSTTPSATSSTVPSSSNSGAASIAYTLDFARVAVLFILQISRSVDTASNAQSSIQEALSDDPPETLNDISVNNFTINLADYHITVPNGTTYGNQ